MNLYDALCVLSCYGSVIESEIGNGDSSLRELDEAIRVATDMMEKEIKASYEKNDPEINYDNPDSPYYLGGHATLEDIMDAQEWEAYDPYDNGFDSNDGYGWE